MSRHKSFIDMTGQRFGQLLAVEYMPKDKRWLIRCDCGVEFKANGFSVRAGLVKTCGHGRRHDMVGMRFGRLTVVERHGTSLGGTYTWRCQCDCGDVSNVDGNSLRNGYTKSCGCLRAELSAQRIAKVCLRRKIAA